MDKNQELWDSELKKRTPIIFNAYQSAYLTYCLDSRIRMNWKSLEVCVLECKMNQYTGVPKVALLDF